MAVTWTTSLDTKGLDGMIAGSLKREASAVVRKTGLDILGLAQSLAPVRTGYLKSSLSPGGPENVAEVQDGGLTMIVGTAVEYGPYVNYGTRFQTAQPFLEPAVEHARPAFEAACQQLIERSIR